MAQNVNPQTPTTKEKDKKGTAETLFGPNIGLISTGPSWTNKTEKKVVSDELTADIVKGWIERSKDTNHPTTTLQALVNLKRPTLRLSPLAPSAEDDHPDAPHHHHHGLEFEYDCDAPKCGIYVHVHLPNDHPEISSSPSSTMPPSSLAKVLVYENVTKGGFGKVLRISDGAILELGRYEMDGLEPVVSDQILGSASTPTPGDQPLDVPASEGGRSGAPSPAPDPSNNTSSNNTTDRRRRFTSSFHFRKRTHNRSVSGPALAVVDAEPPAVASTAATSGAGGVTKAKDDTKNDNDGVRVTIRLAALDEQGAELSSPNEQVTYLHVVRLGTKPTGPDEANEHEDMRPWVVKVVKREATIGPHTFHLHEIFGLSSSSNTAVPTAPLPGPTSVPHTYPPTTPIPTLGTASTDDDPSSECLLCLSSPREVVLLPCRHLVACKECALNMVEFGAGGNITQVVEEQVAVTPAGAGGTGGGTEGEAVENGENPAGAGGNGEDTGNTAGAGTSTNTGVLPTPAIPPTPAGPPANMRRKRKAKGWFCPVCRQPYTSLLRITTTPPPFTPHKEEDVSPVDVNNSVPPATSNSTPPSRAGFSLRPPFLRSLSRPTPIGDIENQVGPVRA